MRPLLKILLIINVIFITAVSCEEEETTNPLIGTWKCLGFRNLESKVLRKIEPQNCEECYFLNFKKNGIFVGKTSTNDITGDYAINASAKELSFTDLGGTKINELFDGDKYVESILSVYAYNKITKDTLYLYYNEQDSCLIFNLIK